MHMRTFIARFSALLLAVVVVASSFATYALPVSAATSPAYDIGNPSLNELWVNPTSGNDANAGTSRGAAVRTIDEAWSRIPQGSNLSKGYRINLVAGTYPTNDSPNYWEQRYGTQAAPIIIQAADGNGTATIPGMNVFDVRYMYLIGVRMAGGNDLLHFEQSDHILLRNVTLAGAGREPQETIKINQSQYIYIEDSDISGAWDNAIDFVGVQYGHVINNKIHNAGDWCFYTKGGSAYFRIEGNEIYDCGTGGYTAGQGTGFEFMTSPWLHYEAYDIKFINNVIHDTEGAAFGVNGGYNILIAYNTAYRVGSRSHVIEVVFGLRGCDGGTSECQSRLNAGGWGIATTGHEEPIPSRNVFIYNNIVYNPAGFQSEWQHFQISGPRTPGGGSHIPSPAKTDTNLNIKGNIIWNGPANHFLGIDGDSGCQDSNTTCNAAQLTRDNAINTVQPQLVNPAGGDFRPVTGGNVFSTTAYTIPNFAGGDRATPPTAAVGDLSNAVGRDRAGNTRPLAAPAGAYSGSSSAAPVTPTPTPTPAPTPTPTPEPIPPTPTPEPIPPTVSPEPFSPSPSPTPSTPPPSGSNYPLPATLAAGTLIKLPDDANINTTTDAVVYYLGADGKRHAFPNERVFRSWYSNFNNLRVITAAQMASLPLGPIITYRPGVRMVKFQTDPKTYAVARGGELRWVRTEAIARAIYGTRWNTIIDDFSDAFFTDYRFGADITSASDYSATSATAGTTTIDQDQGR